MSAYLNARVCKSFAWDMVRNHVIPAYMGLIKQLDNKLVRLFAWMDETCIFDNTIIAFTSDYGDYVGDHWMGDKDFYQEIAVKVPLIIAPTAGSGCNAWDGLLRTGRNDRPCPYFYGRCWCNPKAPCDRRP